MKAQEEASLLDLTSLMYQVERTLTLPTNISSRTFPPVTHTICRSLPAMVVSEYFLIT